MKAINIKPEIIYFAELGNMMSIKLNNIKMGENYLKKSIELDSTNARSLYFLANLYFHKNELSKAQKSYLKACEYDKNLNTDSDNARFEVYQYKSIK